MDTLITNQSELRLRGFQALTEALGWAKRLLLRPSPRLNDIILGVLGRAQRLYPLEIVGYVFASNHYHLLLRVEDAERLSKFMGYFNGNLAREVARLTGWEDKVWSRRYQAILVTDEEAAQVDRLKYILANSCKEGPPEVPAAEGRGQRWRCQQQRWRRWRCQQQRWRPAEVAGAGAGFPGGAWSEWTETDNSGCAFSCGHVICGKGGGG